MVQSTQGAKEPLQSRHYGREGQRNTKYSTVVLSDLTRRVHFSHFCPLTLAIT